jgi:uncharacterized membrane protein YciS (DUF1049 family)
MLYSIIVMLIFAVFAVFIALQNSILITVTLLFWGLKSSLAAVIITAFVTGMVASFILVIPLYIRKNIMIARLRKNIEQSGKSV